jgi:hypothetical protein
MNIHIGCPFCGHEWIDNYIGSGLVDISEVHGAEIVEQASGVKGAVKLVRIEDVYILLTVFRAGRIKGAHCKLVDKEKAHPMFAQAVTDVLTGRDSEL